MKSRSLVLALLLSVTTPAYADDPVTVRGLTCGMTASNDTTGIILQNPTTRVGPITGGPLHVDAGEPVLRTRLDCVVAVTGSWGTDESVRTITVPGAAVVLANFATFAAADVEYGTRTALCTRLSWETGSGTGSRDLGCAPVVYGPAVFFSGEYNVVPSPVTG